MAQKRLYSLLDKAIGTYMNPLVFTTDGEAIRWFTAIVNNNQEGNAIYHHPEDYSLWFLGTLDDTSGELQHQVHRLIDGLAVKEQEKQYTLREIWDSFEKHQQAKRLN